MKKTLLISIALLWSLLSAAQSGKDIVRAISEIKLDSLYVYGDATMETPEQARESAFRLLSDEIVKIKGARMDSSKVSYMQHGRGTMTRVLAYAAITDLRQAEPDAADEEELTRRLEEILISAETISALQTALNERGNPKCSISPLDISTPGQLLEESYVLVCRGTNIQSIYSPSEDGHVRRVLKTGEKTTRINYKTGDTIQWVHIDKY